MFYQRKLRSWCKSFKMSSKFFSKEEQDKIDDLLCAYLGLINSDECDENVFLNIKRNLVKVVKDARIKGLEIKITDDCGEDASDHVEWIIEEEKYLRDVQRKYFEAQKNGDENFIMEAYRIFSNYGMRPFMDWDSVV